MVNRQPGQRNDNRNRTPGLTPIAAGLFEYAPKIVCMPDGSLMAFVSRSGDPERTVYARFSTDSGDTWSELQPQFDLLNLPCAASVVEAVIDRQGEIQVFMLAQWRPDARGEGERGSAGTYRGYRIDIWHTRSSQGRTHWQPPRSIWEGYTGALNSSIRLKSGRLLLPFSYYLPRTWANRGTGLDAFTFMGLFNSTLLYSDDDGATWRQSNDIKVVTPDITYAYGACEPVVLELADGRVWMLIRAQMGRFYEAFSADGARWSQARPSPIISSDSPAGLVRLPPRAKSSGNNGNAGRMVLVWNNCLRHPYAYGGRQVIHAAISGDEGQSWRGRREVGRDPCRADPPPASGDHGTAYPFPVVTSDGQVIISTGQGKGRTLLMRLDPEYLNETVQEADFSAGLEAWSVFGTHGVETVPHPENKDRQALRLQRLDAEFPAAAVWNFPSGASGTLGLRCRFEPGAHGLIIGLTDHFSTPFDFEDVFHNVWTLTVGPAASGSALCLDEGRWHELRLDWDAARQQCRVEADGQPAGDYPLQRRSSGVSYLRLRSVAEDREAGGVLIESVQADVSRAWPKGGVIPW